MAVEREDKLLAATAGTLLYEIAAERAAARAEVKGPGTFIPAFIDEMYLIRQETLRGDGKWAIALRSAEVDADGTVTAFAGAGIVAGSDPDREFAETRLKFRPIVEAFG